MNTLKLDHLELHKELFRAAEVDSFLDKWYPQAEVSTVPYSSEDGTPRVMLSRVFFSLVDTTCESGTTWPRLLRTQIFSTPSGEVRSLARKRTRMS